MRLNRAESLLSKILVEDILKTDGSLFTYLSNGFQEKFLFNDLRFA